MYRKSWLMVFLFLLSSVLLGQTETKLSLMEALRTAVERNLDIQLQRITIESQSLNFNLTRARFEPIFTSALSTQEEDREPSDLLQGASSFTNTTEFFNANYTKSYDFGLKYDVTLGASVFNSGSANTFAGDFFGSNLEFKAEQQLLRGFSLRKEIYRKDQLVAQRNMTISQKDLQTQIDTTLQLTENAYWDLVYTQEQLKVSQQSLDLAKQLYMQNKIKIDVGTLAPIELINTAATVANRERDIIDAENRVRAAEDALKKIMNLPIEAWRQTLVPSDRLVINEIAVNEEEAYILAKQKRSELHKSYLEQQKSQLEINYNENQLKPELRITGRYRFDGSDQDVFSFDQNNNLPPTLVRKSALDESLKEVYGLDFPTYQILLNLSWTPFNKQAKINLAQSRVNLRQAELQRQQTEINIMEEVRAAVRDLEANAKAIRANEKSTHFQEENLKAEEQKFQNGLSTNYRVSEVQDLLAQARSTLIQSKVNYLKAVVSYHKAIGNLSSERQIAIQ